MKIAMIPARYASTRFPFKLMQPLGNATVIWQTYSNCVALNLFDNVYVVTDHQIIFDEINSRGGNAIMSKKNHESGSDRIAEAIEEMEIDIVVNIQGDEPFVNKKSIADLLKCFDDENVKVASLMKKIEDKSVIQNPNYVKVVVGKSGDALYFSRAAIPFDRDGNSANDYYEHIGVYAYRKQVLIDFSKTEMGKLEQIEKLEQLRYLENGISIRMVETNESSVKIDVPEDLEAAEKFLGNYEL